MPWAEGFIKWSGWGVAAVLAALRIYEFWRDVQPRVKVSVTHDVYQDAIQGRLDIVLLKAVNAGRRPVTLVRAALVTSDGAELEPPSHSFFPVGLPCELAEGQEHVVKIDRNKLLGEARMAEAQIIAVKFADATGREYGTACRMPLRVEGTE